MSLKKHGDASLVVEFYGPFFPQSIDELNAVYDYVNWTGLDLAVLFSSLEGFTRVRFAPQTSDGFQWYDAFLFHGLHGVIMVCFPGKGDIEALDGSRMDRSCAFYSFPSPSVVLDLEELCGELVNHMQFSREYIAETQRRVAGASKAPV